MEYNPSLAKISPTSDKTKSKSAINFVLFWIVFSKIHLSNSPNKPSFLSSPYLMKARDLFFHKLKICSVEADKI